MNSQSKRVIVIGLDGADWGILRPLIDSGELPVLKRIIDNGVSGILYSTTPAATPVAFPSFMTGMNPGKHGCLDFVKRKKDSYAVEAINPSGMGGAKIWDIIGGCGKKSLVMNLPCTYPPGEMNGIIISGMLTPRMSNDYCYPADMLDILKNKLHYRVHFREIYSCEKERIDDFKDVTSKRTSTFLYFMDKQHFDLAILHYRGTDILGHYYYKYLDSSHPLYQESKSLEYKRMFLDYMKNLDKNIGMIYEKVKDDSVLMFMSDHGMTVLSRYFYVNNWLIKNGYLVVKNKLFSRLKFLLFKIGFTPKLILNVLSFIKMQGLVRGRKFIAPDKQRKLLQRLFFSLQDIDWDRTKAYSFSGFININLEGREPNGVVRKGSEYEAMRSQIISGLSGLIDVSTGQKVLENVSKKEELYSGPYTEEAGDIILVPKSGYEILGGYEFVSNSITEPAFFISGKHRKEGIFAAVGPEVVGGRSNINLSILDLAPNILHILDIPVSKSMDGKVCRDIFSRDSVLFKREVVYSSYGEPDLHARLRSEEEEEEIKKSLKSLGYIG